MSDSPEEAIPGPVIKKAKENINGTAANGDGDSEEEDGENSNDDEEDEVLRCAACGLLEMLPGLTDYKIQKSERTPLPLNISQISSHTEDSGGLGVVVVCKEITSLGKHKNKTSAKSGTEEDH